MTQDMSDKQGQGYLGVGKPFVADEKVKSEKETVRSIVVMARRHKVGIIVSHSAKSTQTSPVYGSTPVRGTPV